MVGCVCSVGCVGTASLPDLEGRGSALGDAGPADTTGEPTADAQDAATPPASDADAGCLSATDPSGSSCGSVVDGTVADAAVFDVAFSDVMVDAITPDATPEATVDATLDAPVDSVPDSSEDATASDASADADAAAPEVLWDPSESIDTAIGTFPSVTAGPTQFGGSWMVQIQQHYPDTQFDEDYQVGTIGGALGPATTWASSSAFTTPPPGSTLTSMSTGGSLFELASPPQGGALFWYTGQVDPVQSQVSWPYGDITFPNQEIDGYRPRLGSVLLGDGQGAMAAAVYMASSTPGSLAYLTIRWVDKDAGPVYGGISYFSPSVTYDDGISQNPAIALSASTAVEVHQDATTNLYYRLGELTPSTAAIDWQTSAFQYPGREQGAHPAVAIYGSTLVEVHEGSGGDLRWMIGTIGSTYDPDSGTKVSTLTWEGPSVAYETTGVAPAIAIDSSNGNGVEAHQVASPYATLIRRAFRMSP